MCYTVTSYTVNNEMCTISSLNFVCIYFVESDETKNEENSSALH